MFYNLNTEIFNTANKISPHILCVGHAKVGKEWCGKRISPEYSRLYYVIDGSFYITLNTGEKITFSKGNWYLLPSGMDFSFECQKSMEHIYFHIKLCTHDGNDLLRACLRPLSLSDFTHVDFIKNNINTSSITTALMLKSFALETVISIVKKHNIDLHTAKYSSCITKALIYIRDNLSAKLTVTKIAENIFVSKSTLTKHFQKELSTSVNEYVTRLIMSEAETLLSSTEFSIGVISEKLGFSDQLYFSRRFKEIHGSSPREYRKNRCYLIG